MDTQLVLHPLFGTVLWATQTNKKKMKVEPQFTHHLSPQSLLYWYTEIFYSIFPSLQNLSYIDTLKFFALSTAFVFSSLSLFSPCLVFCLHPLCLCLLEISFVLIYWDFSASSSPTAEPFSVSICNLLCIDSPPHLSSSILSVCDFFVKVSYFVLIYLQRYSTVCLCQFSVNLLCILYIENLTHHFFTHQPQFCCPIESFNFIFQIVSLLTMCEYTFNIHLFMSSNPSSAAFFTNKKQLKDYSMTFYCSYNIFVGPDHYTSPNVQAICLPVPPSQPLPQLPSSIDLCNHFWADDHYPYLPFIFKSPLFGPLMGCFLTYGCSSLQKGSYRWHLLQTM